MEKAISLRFNTRTHLAVSADRGLLPEHKRSDEEEDGEEDDSRRGQLGCKAWQCSGNGSGCGVL